MILCVRLHWGCPVESAPVLKRVVDLGAQPEQVILDEGLRLETLLLDELVPLLLDGQYVKGESVSNRLDGPRVPGDVMFEQ